MIPRTVLIAVEPFGEGLTGPGSPVSGRLRHPLSAERAGGAIGRGVRAGDPTLEVEVCPIEHAARGDVRKLLEALDFDRRMRAARAVVVGGAHLDERTLLGSATFEIATRARQAGVPAYAVTACNDLNLFDARILDLQVILQAHDTRSLRRAGERLAGLV
ncbi:MAG: glycerate kinase [Solirubrobacterales bacterium]